MLEETKKDWEGISSLYPPKFSSVQLLSYVWLFATPWIAARQASLSITNSRSSLKFTSIESVMPSSHLTLCRPLLLLPSISPSIRVFSNELALPIKWPKYWSFSIIPSNEWSGLIFIRINWFDLLLSKGLSRFFFSTTAWKHQFFSTQPLQSNSHLYMTIVKTIALLFIWTFVAKVMSLLFDTQPSLS